ncbi:MAG: aldehyde dehydrogenase family protein [Verrucomicrobiota bacterium]
MTPHLPILRAGERYQSLDVQTLCPVGGGEALAEMSMANAGLIRRDLQSRVHGDAVQALAKLEAREIVRICERAAGLWMEGDLPLGLDSAGRQSADEYVRLLSATTGLPHTLCRANMEKVRQGLAEMEQILAGLTRGLGLELFDRGVVASHGVEVGYYRSARSLGVVLPSNSPGVNTLWMPALPMKVPVVLKPGREDPWTPLRIIAALVEAGLPEEAVSFYPAGHDGAEDILRHCGRGIVFGGDATVKKYAPNPNISTHGTGRSKVLIGEDKIDGWEQYLDCLELSVAANSGRSCINASAVVVPRHGREIAVALAERLARRVPLNTDDPDATLAGFANPAMAEATLAALEQDLAVPGAEDVSVPFRGKEFRVEREGLNYLLPTVVYLDSDAHPLFEKELLFPFATVVEMPPAEMTARIGPTLVATAITDDPAFRQDLMECADIDRLNFGPMPTSKVQWNQPHEGNLFEFLYRRRAIQGLEAAA